MENTTLNSNTGLTGQNVQLSGTYVAGRDIIIRETKIKTQKPEFIDVNLDSYESEEYLNPVFAVEVLSIVKEKKIILIGGSYGFDKGAFIRHIASLLKKDVQYAKVKEWLYTGQHFNVFASLQDEAPKSILLLNQIEPQDVNFDISKLLSIAIEKEHYIIISSDIPDTSWKLPNDLKADYWYNVPSTAIYNPDQLTEFICKKFNRNNKDTKDSKKFDSISGKTNITAKVTVHDICERLKDPSKVNLLLNYINSQQGHLSDEGIEQRISFFETSSSQLTLTKWFYSLSETEKIIVVAFIIFDGLYEDQFFCVVKYVVEAYWHLRDQKLQVLDYCDIEHLLNFYKFEQADENNRVLKSSFPNQKIELLKTVWESHRRHIILILPTLITLTRDATHYSNISWELFGNPIRKERFYSVISNTLCEIGVISLESIEHLLIDLASDSSIEVQAVAGRAMASWRENGNSDLLFKVLKNWQQETKIFTSYSDYITNTQSKNEVYDQKGQQSRANQSIEQRTFTVSNSCIRATIALALGYASKYDKQGELSSELITLLKKLTGDTDQQVIERMAEITLPMIISQHFIQIKDNLLSIADKPHFLYAIARGFAYAFINYPEALIALLDEWVNYYNSKTSSSEGNTLYSRPNMMVITAILTLGEIEYTNAHSTFNIENAYKKIVEMQKQFPNKRFRRFFLWIIEKHIQSDLDKTADFIWAAIEQLDITEQQKIAKLLLTEYIKEREKLPNGEYYYGILNTARLYPVWVDKDRPVTKIEKHLHKWLLNESRVIQQFSADCIITLTKYYDTYEQRAIQSIKENRRQEKPLPVTNHENELIIKDVKTTTLMKFALSMMTLPKEKRLGDIIKNIFPIILGSNLEERHVSIIEDNLKRNNGDQKVVGSSVKSIIAKYKTAKFLTILSLIVLIIAIIFIAFSL